MSISYYWYYSNIVQILYNPLPSAENNGNDSNER